ncbi:hypothetical protein O7632_01935 [Solwaraspora sp. WMMD406]|uniref:hypothetical protein n=1 Tax=Solwaraspora sp. WMMD406 TaxID=3016095 RepID=UPI0024167D6A|nr:hypothetical protein [Solwaraspora sp. WMMD406]MDG4762881.1 hypothetical protein [Solwaraspora sp. WMMD406]
MPDAAVPPDDPVPPGAPADELTGYLLSELRAARSAAVRAGADPDAVTADLNERLRRLRMMLAAVDEDVMPTAAADHPPSAGEADGSGR